MTTKTSPVDAIADAQAALDAAARTVEEAQQHDAALRDRILAGDASVTAQQLAESAAVIERAGLDVEAAGLRLRGAEKTAADAEADRIAEAITGAVGNADDVSAAVQQIAEGVAALIGICARRQRGITRGIGEMRAARIPARSNGTQPVPGVGRLAWADAAMGRAETAYVDGRAYSAVEPGTLTAHAIARGVRDAGDSVHRLAPFVTLGVDLNVDADTFVRHHFGDTRD